MITNLIKKLLSEKTQTQPISLATNPNAKIKVCLIDFVDNIESSCAQDLYNQLKNIENLDVTFYKESINKDFLNLEAKHLFDFIDTGLDILYKTKTDVLIWGIKENNNTIRLHFQNENMFSSTSNSYCSILDSLYIPASDTGFTSSIINLVYGAILSSFDPSLNELKIIKKYWLKKVIASLSKDNSAKHLPKAYTPYVMNFLGLIYLSYASYDINEKDYKIAASLFEKAIEQQDLITNPLHLGRLYIHLAQLNDITAFSNKAKPIKFLSRAIDNYKKAQKYETKYNYPYDYGNICYRLSNILYNLYKEKNDIPSLRESVFQLREAEKVFTHTLFPDFWGQIQGDLGYKLFLLGSKIDSPEILNLSIAAYKSQQKIISEKTDAINWAKIQEKIGQIYYTIGKKTKQKEPMEQSLEHFHDALYIFENAQMTTEIKNLNVAILKSSTL